MSAAEGNTPAAAGPTRRRRHRQPEQDGPTRLAALVAEVIDAYARQPAPEAPWKMADMLEASAYMANLVRDDPPMLLALVTHRLEAFCRLRIEDDLKQRNAGLREDPLAAPSAVEQHTVRSFTRRSPEQRAQAAIATQARLAGAVLDRLRIDDVPLRRCTRSTLERSAAEDRRTAGFKARLAALLPSPAAVVGDHVTDERAAELWSAADA